MKKHWPVNDLRTKEVIPIYYNIYILYINNIYILIEKKQLKNRIYKLYFSFAIKI